MKIVITVEGGVVQSVHSTTRIDVMIIDVDDLECDGFSGKQIEAMSKRAIDGLVEDCTWSSPEEGMEPEEAA